MTASNQPHRRRRPVVTPNSLPGLGQVIAAFVEQLGGERARAHPGRVSLQNSQHGGDPGRTDARPDGRPTRSGIRRRHIRIGAVIDVEQGALRALEQHRFAGIQRIVEQQPGVGDAMLEARRLLEQSLHHVVGVQRLAVVDLDQDLVLEFERRLDLVGQQFGVEHVGDPNPHPGDLVLVARSDAAAGGADLLAAHVALGDLVDGDVVGQQQVRVGGDQQLRRVHAAVFEALQFVEQDAGVHHHAVADHVGDSWREDSRRDQMQREILAGGQYDGVPGVVATLIAHYPLHAPAEQVSGFTFALVAPLGADETIAGMTRSHLIPLLNLLIVVQPGTYPIPANCEELLEHGREHPQRGSAGFRGWPGLGRLSDLPAYRPDGPAEIDSVIGDYGRLVVVGADADLATVLSRLLRADRLDIEVAYVPRRRTTASRVYRLPAGRRAARRARRGSPQRVNLIRDETGSVIVGRARWLPADEQQPARGEAVVDDTRLFDGDVTPVAIEPTLAMPGLRASLGRTLAPLDRRPRGPVGQHRGDGGTRRCPGPALGSPVDVLPQRRRMAAGPVVFQR